jgi:hypothetical protein
MTGMPQHAKKFQSAVEWWHVERKAENSTERKSAPESGALLEKKFWNKLN